MSFSRVAYLIALGKFGLNWIVQINFALEPKLLLKLLLHFGFSGTSWV